MAVGGLFKIVLMDDDESVAPSSSVMLRLTT